MESIFPKYLHNKEEQEKMRGCRASLRRETWQVFNDLLSKYSDSIGAWAVEAVLHNPGDTLSFEQFAEGFVWMASRENGPLSNATLVVSTEAPQLRHSSCSGRYYLQVAEEDEGVTYSIEIDRPGSDENEGGLPSSVAVLKVTGKVSIDCWEKATLEVGEFPFYERHVACLAEVIEQVPNIEEILSQAESSPFFKK